MFVLCFGTQLSLLSIMFSPFSFHWLYFLNIYISTISLKRKRKVVLVVISFLSMAFMQFLFPLCLGEASDVLHDAVKQEVRCWLLIVLLFRGNCGKRADSSLWRAVWPVSLGCRSDGRKEERAVISQRGAWRSRFTTSSRAWWGRPRLGWSSQDQSTQASKSKHFRFLDPLCKRREGVGVTLTEEFVWFPCTKCWESNPAGFPQGWCHDSGFNDAFIVPTVAGGVPWDGRKPG